MKFFKYVFPLIFAVMFSIPLIVIIATLPAQRHWEDIAKNGEKVTGKITGTDYRYDSDDEEYDYWYMYEFELNGEKYTGKSRNYYSRSGIEKYYPGKQIEISYIYEGEDIQYVESTYNYDEVTLIIVGCVFQAVAVGAFIVFLKFFIDAIKRGNVRRHGAVTVGHITDYTSNTRVNGVPYYNIKYYWTAENGEVINTTSPADYTYNQAKYYSDVKDFEIKAKGKLSVITEAPFTKRIEAKEAFAEDVSNATPQEDLISCEYCNITFKRGSGKCPCCGAPITYKRNVNKY